MMKKLNRFKLTCIWFCCPCWLVIPATAAVNTEDPWFEIELIAFERSDTQQLREIFTEQVTPIQIHGSVDLFSPLYLPKINGLLQALPYCLNNLQSMPAWQFNVILPGTSAQYDIPVPPQFEPVADNTASSDFNNGYANAAQQVEPNSISFAKLAELSISQYQNQWQATTAAQWPVLCLPSALPKQGIVAPTLIAAEPYPTEVAGPRQLPVTPEGTDLHSEQPYLAPAATLQLKDLAYQLERRAGHPLLLHTIWRQRLAAKRRAVPMRIFAGQQWSPEFNYQGLPPLPPSPLMTDTQQIQAQISKLETLLKNKQDLSLLKQAVVPAATLPSHIWQLDGLITLYNERMLFAETEFNLRRPTAAKNSLQTYYSKDITRLFVGDLHYLDHPYLGLVIQIRRFTPPLLAPATEPK